VLETIGAALSDAAVDWSLPNLPQALSAKALDINVTPNKTFFLITDPLLESNKNGKKSVTREEYQKIQRYKSF
jgi:hypothetical protein